MPDPLSSIAPEKQEEARRLDAIFREATGWQPKLWGSMIGYGQYHYRYESGREGDSLATGFAMRAREISIYIMAGYTEFPEIAARLGPHKRGKACWYIKSVDHVDEAALKDLIRAGLIDLADKYEVTGT